MADNGNAWNGGSNGGGVLFTNVRVLDGTGEYPYTGEVLVQGNRIKSIAKGSSRFSSSSSMGGGQTVIDGMGATLMPGLIDAHLHLSWNNAPGIDPIQMMEVEEHMLVTMEMAKIVLDAGFTAGRGAAGAHAARTGRAAGRSAAAAPGRTCAARVVRAATCLCEQQGAPEQEGRMDAHRRSMHALPATTKCSLTGIAPPRHPNDPRAQLASAFVGSPRKRGDGRRAT